MKKSNSTFTSGIIALHVHGTAAFAQRGTKKTGAKAS